MAESRLSLNQTPQKKISCFEKIKRSLLMNNNPIEAGILAIVSPIPCFMLTVFWSWIWAFAIGLGLLNYETIPQWILVISFLPLLTSPLLGVWAIIHAFIKIKEKGAWIGILLGLMGLAGNAILFSVMWYMGSNF